MKKSFTLFSVSALFLMLLFPTAVKGDDIVRYFGYQDNQWTQNSNEGQTSCAGNIGNNDKIITGSDFYYSGRHDEAFKRADDEWTGVNGANNNYAGVTACTRESKTVSLAVGSYTFKLLSKHTEGGTMTLPKITVGSDEYSVNAVLNSSSESQTFSSEYNQFAYTSGNEFTLCYTVTISGSAYNGNVSIEFKDGWKEKYLFKSLTITPATPACSGETVTVVADNDDHGTVTGSGSYCANARVDIAATPNDHYSFVNWTVTSGTASLNDASSASTYFTMSDPAAAVTVQANFEYTPCTKTKVIQCEDYDNSHVCGSTPVPSTLIINSDHTGYAHDDYPKWHGSGFADFQAHNTGGQIFFPITLPAGTYTFSVICANGGDKKIRIYNSSCSKVVDDISLSNDWGGSGWVTATTPAQTLDAGDYYISLYASNHYAAFDQITISATSNVFCPTNYDITLVNTAGGSAVPTAEVNSSSVTEAEAGTTVTVTAAAANSGYYFSGWSASPTVTFSDASVSPATFSMPASDVTITANYAALVSSTFTYTTSGSGSISCATASGSDVTSGTVIEMTAVPSTDYVFTGWTATAGSFSDASALTTNFTMPASAATVTANFAQVDNVITVGSESGSSADIAGGGASITESNISDFDAFAHNVIKLAYSNMSGSDKWYGWNLGKQGSYNSANSAGATGFGFYYKTESTTDAVALWFDPNHGDKDENQHGMQLPATNNVWKYVYFAHADANSWNKSYIRIFINGDKESKSTANASGAIYIADIAATSITSKPDIANYLYTNNRGGAMQVNDYGTLCLPMAGTIEGATLYSVAGKELGDVNYLVLEDKGTTVEAGKPYITQSTATSYTVTMSGVHSDVQAGNGLVGTYTEINPLGQYAAEGPHNYVLWNNKFLKAGTGISVGAYRAYLNFDAIVAAPSPAPGVHYVRMAIEGTDIQTGIETVNGEWVNGESAKILRGGHLFILRDGKTYNAQGQMIK